MTCVELVHGPLTGSHEVFTAAMTKYEADPAKQRAATVFGYGFNSSWLKE